MPDYVYSDKRLLYPMKREKKDRGKDKWIRISWNEAYDLIEQEMQKIAEEYGPESVIFCQGTGRDIHQLFRLAYSYGSPNEGTPFFSGQSCYLPRIASMAVMLGGATVSDCSQFLPLRYDDPEYHVPALMILWGNQPVWSNPDGFFGHWVTDLMKRGMKIAVIDPQLSWLAARAGRFWLRLRPGTDGAIAMGMLKVILDENLYDQDFCDKWVYGLDALIERVGKYNLDELAELSWVPREKIEDLARVYAAAKPATIQWGVAIDHATGGQQASHGITALWTITGNLDVPGGNVIGQSCWGIEESNWTGGWGYDDVLPEGQKAKRLGVAEYPMFQAGFLNCSPDISMQALKTGKPYRIHGLWLETSNFVVGGMSAQPKEMTEYARELNFNVVVDLLMTPTAMELADVILPASTYAERIGFGGLDPYYIGGIIQAIDPVGESRADNQIIMDMGKRFNPDAWPWENLEEMNDALLAQGGFTYHDLVESTWKYPKFEYRKYEKGLLRADGQLGFNTATGRAEIFCPVFQQIGLDPLPSYVETYQSPYSNPDKVSEYPLVLTSGARQPVFFHSEHRHIAKLRRLHPAPLLYIHSRTADRYGIAEGDSVYVENDLGKARYKAAFNDTYDERVVQAEHGWWFPERDSEDQGEGSFGAWESNVNNLIPVKCGISGFGACFKTMICKVYKA
jgi:anaerobic selenocysteine-containing dehydrogenase